MSSTGIWIKDVDQMTAAIQVVLFLIASILVGAATVIISNVHMAGWAKRSSKKKADWIALLSALVIMAGMLPSLFLMLRAGMILVGNHGRPSSTVFMLIFPVMLIWFFGLVGLAYLYERKVYNPKSFNHKGP